MNILKHMKTNIRKGTKMYVVDRDGNATHIWLNLKTNRIQSLVTGGVKHLRKLGWNIGRKRGV
jgi:hypothetical protein